MSHTFNIEVHMMSRVDHANEGVPLGLGAIQVRTCQTSPPRPASCTEYTCSLKLSLCTIARPLRRVFQELESIEPRESPQKGRQSPPSRHNAVRNLRYVCRVRRVSRHEKMLITHIHSLAGADSPIQRAPLYRCLWPPRHHRE